jgi:hypothetical protein
MAMVIASFKVVCYSDIYLEGARKDAWNIRQDSRLLCGGLKSESLEYEAAVLKVYRNFKLAAVDLANHQYIDSLLFV